MFALSPSSKRDLIVKYFFHKGFHNLNVVNDVLYTSSEPTL